MLGFPYHDRDYQRNTIVMQATVPITNVKADEQELLRTLGGRVKWAREKRGLSQSALAAAAGIKSQGTIGNLEAGHRKKPRELLSIAKALGASPSWLETGRGTWDAHAAQAPAASPAPTGGLFNELNDQERAMLKNYRRLLDKDRHRFDEEISKAAEERQQEMDEIFARFGVAKAADRANSRQAKHTASTTVAVGHAKKRS
jgi:transcriptional regulator with XRE-family HTH domain